MKVLDDRFIYAEANAVCVVWTTREQRRLKDSIKSVGAVKSQKLLNEVKGRTKKRGSRVSHIGFSMPKHGVYVHKGVGRGYEMISGRVVRTATGTPRPKERKPEEWFNPVIEKDLPDLAKDLGDAYAKATGKQLAKGFELNNRQALIR